MNLLQCEFLLSFYFKLIFSDIGDAASFVVAIYDKTSPGKIDFMGEVIIPVNGLKLDGSNNWFSLKERKKGKKMGVKGGKKIFCNLNNIIKSYFYNLQFQLQRANLFLILY